MGWIIALVVADFAVKIGGAIARKNQADDAEDARAKLADINIAQQELQEQQTIKQLEKQRDTTVSRQQARTGRGGLTAEGSPLIIEQSILETFGTAGTVKDIKVGDTDLGGLGSGLSVGIADLTLDQELSGGSGAIGFVQQQGILARQAISAGEDLANIQSSYSNVDLGLDILASTLDAATSIYAYNYQFNQTNINDPFRDFQQAWEVF